ncbi:MAG: copper transporter [Halanaerobium sp.]|nr:copper transporter [Halanaerobium sp.]
MLIGLRYHLSTIITIFLVLTLGILIGSVLEGEGTLIAEQKRLIERLEKDFHTLRSNNNKFREEIAALKVDLEENRQFQDELLKILLKGRLSGLQISLAGISKEEYPQFFQILNYCGIGDGLAADSSSLGEKPEFQDYFAVSLLPGEDEVLIDDTRIDIPEKVLTDPVETVKFVLMLEEQVKGKDVMPEEEEGGS